MQEQCLGQTGALDANGLAETVCRRAAECVDAPQASFSASSLARRPGALISDPELRRRERWASTVMCIMMDKILVCCISY